LKLKKDGVVADVTLKVQWREKVGKGHARDLRRRSFIPAILYGGAIEPVPLEVSVAEFEKALKTRAGENVILNLKIEGDKKGKKSHTAIIKDIQLNPVTDRVQHVDFNVISMTQKIRVNVPLHEKGEAPGAHEGGVLDRIPAKSKWSAFRVIFRKGLISMSVA
jgi:large subunit ribosomal protein L25